MTRDDIIRMANEAWGEPIGKPWAETTLLPLEKFANLVVADYQERTRWDGIHSCHADCQRPVCVSIRKAVADEREACAKVCEEFYNSARNPWQFRMAANECALAIRERGAL